jgi:hypothetical protein
MQNSRWARIKGRFTLAVHDNVFDLRFVTGDSSRVFFSTEFWHGLAVHTFLTHPEIAISDEWAKKAVVAAQEGSSAIIPR